MTFRANDPVIEIWFLNSPPELIRVLKYDTYSMTETDAGTHSTKTQ